MKLTLKFKIKNGYIMESLEKTIEQFLKKVKVIHNNKYDYSLLVYINSQTKVKIICTTHGVFEQTPAKHAYGQGCKQCSQLIKYNQKYNTENLKELLNNTETNFDYSLVNINNKTIKDLITIICPEHGSFEQKASYHIKHRKCPHCSSKNNLERLKNNNDKAKLTTKTFIEKAVIIHKNKYDYSSTLYNHSKEKLKIICKDHGTFEQIANSHLQGSGCPRCAIEYRMSLDNYSTYLKESFIKTPKENAIFYILECWNETEKFYKIGITTRSVKERYQSPRDMPYTYKILKEIINTPSYIWDLENNLKLNLKSKYKPKTYFSGSVKECYLDLNEILNNLRSTEL